MKLNSKKISALSLAVIFAFAAQTQAAPVAEPASKPVLILNEAIANKAVIKGEYAVLKLEHLDLAPELKGVQFDFNELLKARDYIVNAGYDSTAAEKDYALFSYSRSASRTMDRNIEQLKGAAHEQYMATLDQAFKQAPVLAYYEYMTTGQAPQQKDLYSLVQYQNEKYGHLRLTELPVALKGEKNDLFMLNLLSKVIMPADSVLTYHWHKTLSKNNMAPFKVESNMTWGDLFTANRTQHAQAAMKADEENAQQPLEIAASALLKQQRQDQQKVAMTTN